MSSLSEMLVSVPARVSLNCFAWSYGLAFAAELTQLFKVFQWRRAVVVTLTIAGWIAQSCFLWFLVSSEANSGNLVPLASWLDWCLMTSWVLAALYLGLTWRRPKIAFGLFLLPMILALTFVAYALQNSPPFSRDTAISVWGAIHGISLLLGTVTVLFGFAAGLMYLTQSSRLKRKQMPRSGISLPSLEWLQNANRNALLLSSGFLGIGLISGYSLNLVKQQLSWNNPVIITSSVLFLWLLAANVFEYVYKPARQGRKVVYLTFASFLFLVVALVFVLMGDHAV